MTSRKQSLSTGRAWLLCWYIQFTGFIISVVQYNATRTLSDLGCFVTNLQLTADFLHWLRLLLNLVAYASTSLLLFKSRPSPLLVGSGCLSVAVVCALMGGAMDVGESEADMREHRGDDPLNSALCSPISFTNRSAHEWSSWEVFFTPPLIAAVAVHILLVYGTAVHFTAGMILVESVSGGLRTPLVVAFLLMALNSAPYIGSLFTPLLHTVEDRDFTWEAVLRRGWAPLGLTSLFLTPIAVLVTPAKSPEPPPTLAVTSLSVEAAKNPLQRRDVREKTDVERKDEEWIGEDGRGFFKCLLKVCRNHLVLSNLLSQLCIGAAIVGVDEILGALGELLDGRAPEDSPVEGFLIKYSAHFRNYCPAVFLFVSGVVIFRLRPKPRRLLLWCIMVLVTMLVFAVMWTRSNDGNLKISLQSTPDESCSCSVLKNLISSPPLSIPAPPLFTSAAPLCAEDGTIFSSPCQAGCTDACNGPNRTQYYSDCTALPSNASTLSSDQCVSVNGHTGRDRFLWFLYIFIGVKSLVSSARVIGVFVSIRCVSLRQKPISIAFMVGGAALVAMLDRENLYAEHITELSCLAILFTLITWHSIHISLYEPNQHSSRTGKHIVSFPEAGKTKSSTKHENSTLLPRDSLIDESELLDVRIMSRQRDSIDVTKSKRFRLKRLSLDYRKRSLPSFNEHVVYP